MSRKIFLLSVFLVSIFYSQVVYSQENLGLYDPRVGSRYIGSDNPIYDKEIDWFINEWNKGTQASYTMGQIYYFLSGNYLKPYLSTTRNTQFKLQGFEDYILERNGQYEYIYVLEIREKDIVYDAMFRTIKDVRYITIDGKTKEVLNLHSQLLYIADKIISSDEFFKVLPIFLNEVGEKHGLKDRRVHIRHISGDSNSKTRSMEWTLFALQRLVAQAVVTVTYLENGSVKVDVRARTRPTNRPS